MINTDTNMKENSVVKELEFVLKIIGIKQEWTWKVGSGCCVPLKLESIALCTFKYSSNSP